MLGFVALACGLLPSATAFSSGAGQCLTGEPSVSSLHLTAASVTTGSLQDGGFTVKVLTTPVSDGGFVTVGNAIGFPTLVEIEGGDFRGAAVIVSGSTESDKIDIEAGDNLVAAANCPGQAAVTHPNADIKSTANLLVTINEEASLNLDVNVVVQNSGGVSEYYYSSFRLEAISRTLDGLFQDCVIDLDAADADNNRALSIDEYYDYIVLFGQDKCYTPPGNLTETQRDVFSDLTCSICLENGGDQSLCCDNPIELPIKGASSPNTVTVNEYNTLRRICETTYATIPPECESGPMVMPTVSPSRGPPTVAPTAAPTGEPTPVPPTKSPVGLPTVEFDKCFGSMVAADSDNSQGLDESEYYDFIILEGKAKCYVPPVEGQLTRPQKVAFDAIACSSCAQILDQDLSCCSQPGQVFTIEGAESPGDLIEERRTWLQFVCRATDAVIISPDGCEDTSSPTKTPTTSPMMAPTRTPTTSPTIAPTRTPTTSPTIAPTRTPTTPPTKAGSPTPSPTKAPVESPSTIIPPKLEVSPDSKDETSKLYADQDRGNLDRRHRRVVRGA